MTTDQDVRGDETQASAVPSGLVLQLRGKVALVTGGSRGIGAATVRTLRSAGARVVFSYRSAEAQARALVDACGGSDVCRALQQELRTAEEGEALIQAARDVFGKLDILVVNHGVWPPHDQPVEAMSTDQWRGTLGVNLDSVFGLVRAAAAVMLGVPAEGTERNTLPDPTTLAGVAEYGEGQPTEATRDEGTADAGELLEEAVYSDRILYPAVSTANTWEQVSGQVRGHIVLVASTAAQRGEAFHADYAASKGALLSLTKSLSSELGPKGILCNCVAPGWVRTEMAAGTLDDPERAAKALSFIPLGRAAEPEEIAGPIAFLCTPWAGFISGEVWNINGGAVLVG